MPRMFGEEKKANLFVFPKLLFSLLTHMQVRQCLMPAHAPRSPLPEQSCWGMRCSAALALWGGCPAPAAAGAAGSSSSGSTESPLAQPAQGRCTQVQFWWAPHHTSAVPGFAMYNFNKAGCFWDTVSEPTFITLVLHDDWSGTSQAVPVKGRPNADQATEARDPGRGKAVQLHHTNPSDRSLK